MAPIRTLLVGMLLAGTLSNCLGGECAPKDEVSLLSINTKTVQRRATQNGTQANGAADLEQVLLGPPVATTPFYGISNAHQADVPPSKCAKMMKDTLKKHGAKLPGLDEIGHRIGAMLGAQFVFPDTSGNFDKDCCEEGTEYDKFLINQIPTITKEEFKGKWLDSKTALIIVDVQRDFNVGSFAEPCWGHGGEDFAGRIAKLAEALSEAGGTVIASKDFHPFNHCSFEGNPHCHNTKDYDSLELEPGKRYVNEFPSHCTYKIDESGKLKPQEGPDTPFCQDEAHHHLPACQRGFVGTELHDTIAAVMKKLGRKKPEKTAIVFKGINKDYDSFSVIPHTVSKGISHGTSAEQLESKWTGGYAIEEGRAERCFKSESVEAEICIPTAQEIQNPTSKMRSMQDIFKKNGIEKIISLGLVWDFCVKETAIFGTQLKLDANKPGLEAVVLADLARPTFDGKPGAPYFAAICPGGASDGNFCTAGGGTPTLFDQTLQHYYDAGVFINRGAAHFEDDTSGQVDSEADHLVAKLEKKADK